MTAIAAPHPKVLSDEEILKIVATLPYRTSWELYWPGVEVHRYRLPAGGGGEHSYPRLAVFLSQLPEAFNLDIRAGGVTTRHLIPSDSVSIVAPHFMHTGRRDLPGELTAIFLDLSMVSEIAVAFTGVEEPEIATQYGIHDPVVRALGERLDAELFANRPSPRVYIESLARALGAHIIATHAKPVFSGGDLSAMTGTQLRRSVEFMKENLEKDVTLEDVASAATMSKYHFAKSFKHAMGVAPHQYLVRLRMEKARRMLALDSLSVEQVANSVGYTDKSHFAEQFRRCTGLSPSHYRRLK